MYKVDTTPISADVYEARPLDLSNAMNVIESGKSRKFAQQQQQAKADEARDADINSNIASLNAMKIMPRDQQLAADKLKGVRDYVVKNNGMKDATPEQQMEFQKLIGDAKMFSDLSQNHREALETRGLEIMKNPEQYRPEALDYYKNQFSTDNAGNFDLDDSQFKQKFDYYGHVIKNLLPAAKSEADANQTPYSEKFTPEQAKAMIAKDISSNPTVADEALYQFNKAEDKMGATTASEYMQNKYANDLVVNMKKAGPQSSGSGDDNKNKVRLNWTQSAGGEKYATITVNGRKPQPVTVEDSKNPGYTKTYQPMKYIKKPDGKVVLLATDTKTNKLEELDYNVAQNTLFQGYGIENPIEMMEDPKSTGANVKEQDLKKGGTYNIKGKKYTLKQLQDLGYTEEQVAQYKAK